MDRIELVDKRKPREKHFLQKDGTICAEIFNEDIHYLKDGKYEEIDNTIVKEDNVFLNKSNDYRVEFKDNFIESLMKISKNNCFIDFKIIDKKSMKLKPGNRKVTKEKRNTIFSQLNDDISIEYQVLSNKVKETIILQNANYSKLSFELDTNLKLKEEDGEIYAIDNENKSIFKIEQPFMVDANGIKNNKVYYSIDSYEDAYILNLTLDDEWLLEEGREYPIYIDPTISNEGNDITLYDTYIYPGDSQDDRDSKPYIKAGTEKINGQDRINRALIKFTLPEIGTGSYIIGAQLALVPYYESFHEQEGTLSRRIEVRRITDSWDPATATWSMMNDKYDSRVESITFFERSAIINNVVYWGTTYLDITNLVKRWYSGVTNNGLMIKSCDEGYYDENYPMFFSTNNSITGNPKPIVTIYYENQNGLEGYYDYKSANFIDGSTYVNTYNGNMTAVFDVGMTPGERLPAQVSLVYNSNDILLDNSSPFGKGFKLNYDQKIIENDENILTFIDEDGTNHYFHKGGYGLVSNREFDSNTYYDEDGLNLKVSIEQNNICKMIDINGNEKTFEKYNNIYYLKNIKDINNNTITVTLDSNQKITKITDINNQEINITYNSSNTIVSCPIMTTTINKTNDFVTSIQTINGTTTITYNNLNLIDTIQDSSGLKYKYEYYQTIPYKISMMKRYGINNGLGESYAFEYFDNSTAITNNEGLIEVISFNDIGNAIERNYQYDINDLSSAYSIKHIYGDGDRINRVLSNIIPLRYSKNYLTNSSFETDGLQFTIDDGVLYYFDTNNAHSGNRSLRLETVLNSKKMSSAVSLTGNKYYTFSGYFKGNGSASITLSYMQHGTQQMISSTQDIELSSEFEREDVTIYYGNDAMSDLNIIIEFSNGVLYVDDVQLEEGEVANNYNIMDNADFSEGLSDWTLYAGGPNGDADPTDCMSVVNINSNNETALKVEMDPVISTALVKKFDIKGKIGDAYTISFWYKNSSVIPYMPNSGSAVSIFYEPDNNENGHCIVSQIIPTTGDETWHYFIHKEVAIEDFKSITINFSQTGTANNFYLTNLAFYKDVTIGEYDYDNNGNLVAVNDSLNNTSQFAYNVDNQINKITSASGKKIKYEYDKNKKSRLINTISSGGVMTENKYDNNGNIYNVKVANKAVNNISISELYTIRNYGTNKFIKAELSTVLLETNDCSNTKWKLQENNGKYKIIYDACPQYSIAYLNGNIVLSDDDTNNLFDIETNDNGSFHIRYIEETNEGTAIRYLKANNQSIETTLYNGESSDIEFYIEKVPEQFLENDIEYSNDGRFEEKNIDSNFSETEYELNSYNGLLTKMKNANGVETTYLYNAKNKIASISCQNRLISYAYNASGLLSGITVGNKNYNFAYDEFLNPIRTKINNNTLVENSYSNGKVSSISYANGDTINYYYDIMGRLMRIQKDNTNYYYKYDNNGNISKVLSSGDEKRYYYDINNRIRKYKYNDFQVKYYYDNDNNNISKKYKCENHEHINEVEYNNDNLTKLTIDNIEIDYENDSLGRNISKKINNHNFISLDYLTNGKRTSNEIVKMTSNGNDYKYVYDKLGNITEVYLNNTLICKYFYDDFSQLIASEDYINQKKYEYTYNINSNLIEKKVINMANNSVIEDVLLDYSNTNWEDQLTSYGGNSITYDSFGNVLSYGNNKSFTWSHGKELIQYVDTLQNVTANYEYDVTGIRRSKTVNNDQVLYYTENNRIIYEKRNNDIIYYLYDPYGIIGLIYNNNTYYYEKNLKGDIIGILNSQYQKVLSYEYDNWGKILSIKDSLGQPITDPTNIGIINPFRYRGYYYDEETGFYYLNSRYYNPEWCRFISPDIMLSSNQDFPSFNLYVYASNNPIVFSDSSGYGIFEMISNAYKKVEKQVKKKIKSVANAVINTIKETVGKAVSIVTSFTTTTVDSKVRGFGITVTKGKTTTTTVPMIGSDDSVIKINPFGFGSSIGGMEIDTPLFSSSFEPAVSGFDCSMGLNVGSYANVDIIYGVDNGYVYGGTKTTAEVNGIETGEYTRVNVHGALFVVVVVASAISLPTFTTAPAWAPALSLI